ncbi:type IV secretion system protein VirB9 [Fodinibius roseus]|uniref:Type IV secretion system protein VirB9 n=1 Tax=Fodinibius roseus TaxID=1194090 RepID=A0A1M5KQL3_9BACT|nr:TrbG/VirB9 family P-type conjugative transfer protein [Fodinibius roseus]SHG54799.1 type IV secretion system protein VirB9 [Fodinibius roseus]
MKKVTLTFLLLYISSLCYGQNGTDQNTSAIPESSDSGALTYEINRRSNVIEYPYGYSQATLKATPLRLSLIQLQEGEKVLSMSAGDTRRWKITKSFQGSAGQVTPIIQVKPITDNISTNLIITTDRRTYDVTLESPALDNNSTNPKGSFTRRITFYYPGENNFGSIGQKPNNSERGPAALSSAVTTPEEKKNHRYKIEKGKYGFPWEPVEVYDNGKNVVIQMPDHVNAQDLPVLFVVNEVDEKENLNYSFNPETNEIKSNRLFKKGVLIKKFKHPGFAGFGTVTDEKELFIIRK